MSREEKAMILQMVADGKITPEQGAELLRAVSGVPEAPKNVRVEPSRAAREFAESIRSGLQDTLESARVAAQGAAANADDIADSVAKKMEGVGEAAQLEGERIGRVLGESGANIGKLIAGMFAGSSYGGHQQELHEILKGELPADGVLDISLSTTNGHIIVQSADQPNFSLDVRKRANASTEEDAKAMFHGKYEFTHDGNVLRATSRDLGNGYRSLSIGFTLTIPKGRKAIVRVNSANGRLTLEDLTGPELVASTSNGRVVADGCDFERTDLTTANGRIEFEGKSEELKASTSNGRIQARLYGDGNWSLDTANGRIEAEIDRVSGAGYEVDASTTMGRVEVRGFDRQEILVDESRQRHGSRFVGRTKGFDEAHAKASLKATSARGRVVVSL